MQTVWTQIRPEKMSGLIKITTAWHSDGILKIIFQKKLILKKSADDKKAWKISHSLSFSCYFQQLSSALCSDYVFCRPILQTILTQIRLLYEPSDQSSYCLLLSYNKCGVHLNICNTRHKQTIFFWKNISKIRVKTCKWARRLMFGSEPYGKHSKIVNTICLKKRPRQTVQPRSDCFLRSSLIRVFPVCYSD